MSGGAFIKESTVTANYIYIVAVGKRRNLASTIDKGELRYLPLHG